MHEKKPRLVVSPIKIHGQRRHPGEVLELSDAELLELNEDARNCLGSVNPAEYHQIQVDQATDKVKAAKKVIAEKKSQLASLDDEKAAAEREFDRRESLIQAEIDSAEDQLKAAQGALAELEKAGSPSKKKSGGSSSSSKK